MASSPRSPPHSDMPLEATSRKTRQSTQLRRLTIQGLDQLQPMVTINPTIGRGLGPHKEKFHSYLGVVAREKIPILHSTWNDVPKSLKNLVSDDILGKFDIPEGDNAKKKVVSTVATRQNMFMLTKTVIRKMILLLSMVLMQQHGQNLQKATKPLTGSVNPPSPVSRHVKWKMARMKRYGQMTYTAAQEISNKIVSNYLRTTQGSFIPHGRDDILNMAIGRLEHPGRVRVVGTGVTISQHLVAQTVLLDQSVNNNWLKSLEELRKEVEEENKNSQEVWRRTIEEQNKHNLEIMKHELKHAIKLELSQIVSQHSPPLEAPDIQVLAARVSMKGSCAKAGTIPSVKEPSDVHVDTMDDVVRVSVVKVYHCDAQVPLPTPKIQFVRQAVGTFVGWPTHLVKAVPNEDSQKGMSKRVTSATMDNTVAAVDPLGELVKNLFDVYQKPIQLPWDGAKFGIHNVKEGFFITHADVTEIILGDKCLNISILQLSTMFMNYWSTCLDYGSLHGFLEPQCIHKAKDKRQECEQYIQTWVKESQKQDNIVVWLCSLRKKPNVYIKGAFNRRNVFSFVLFEFLSTRLTRNMSAVVAGSSSSMSATFTTRRSPFLKNSQGSHSKAVTSPQCQKTCLQGVSLHEAKMEDKDEDEDEDVHLAPDSADDAPRTIPQQGSSEQVNVVPSRPSAHIVGIINKNWHS
ncbi:Exosome complex exonuclease RRP44 A [Glycine max]|nr:Exosome complex exonuclease RRP44 A [Glycine max]